jgi:hypothetical protein
MKVIKWISSEEADKLETSIGGLGGWFSEGHRWGDYLAILSKNQIQYAEALREDIIKRQIKESGSWHQNSDIGTPVFEDNTIGSFSFRAWGDLLAAIWSTEENRDSHYMEFYC